MGDVYAWLITICKDAMVASFKVLQKKVTKKLGAAS
jgi:hypothetical protein